LIGATWWLARQAADGGDNGEGRNGAPTSQVAVAELAAGLACWLALVQPAIFFLSRFGRPEIAVAACTVLSSALGLWAWRSAGHTWWRHAAAGHAAGLAFLMHQYGALAVGALGASYLLRGPRSWQRTLRHA